MSLTTKQIEEQREQAQEDIRSILDSCSIAIDDEQVDKVCQVIVDRMNILRDANNIPDGSKDTSLPPARPFFTDEFGDMENSRD
jgi:hypothetical protein